MSDADFSSLLESILWPLLVGGLAAFSYLVLLSASHRKWSLLTQLCRDLGAHREKQEKQQDEESRARSAAWLLKLQKELHEILKRQGLKAGPPPAPEKKPQAAVQSRETHS